MHIWSACVSYSLSIQTSYADGTSRQIDNISAWRSITEISAKIKECKSRIATKMTTLQNLQTIFQEIQAEHTERNRAQLERSLSLDRFCNMYT